MLEKLNVEGEKLGAWRELMQGGGEQDGKEKCNLQQKRKSAFIPGAQRTRSGCTVCESVGGKVSELGLQDGERPESHNGEAEGSNFLNLVVCASSEQDKTKTGVFKDSSKDGCHSWQGNGTEKRSTIL